MMRTPVNLGVHAKVYQGKWTVFSLYESTFISHLLCAEYQMWYHNTCFCDMCLRVPFPSCPSLWGVMQQRKARAGPTLQALGFSAPGAGPHCCPDKSQLLCKERAWRYHSEQGLWIGPLYLREILGIQVPRWTYQVHNFYRLNPFREWEQKWNDKSRELFPSLTSRCFLDLFGIQTLGDWGQVKLARKIIFSNFWRRVEHTK